ncbi:hypothetical protein [Corynebacterium callunae]|uniref:hypothetical protein n=1 Tax=Corynebacterium callunae TaxID=1721 RepID=UPI001FFF19AE|nr:hypothetical protein [Corynebacterium callunae]MCK2199181.1 hypothetical protein [Corynebacterium callunae]
MTITPTRTYEQIKKQVGPVTGKPPGAWWVGTDKTLPMRDEYLAARQADRERREALAASVDADPKRTWSTSRDRMSGFTPNDPNNPHKALREDRNTQGMWVPNKRTKAGKELAAEMEAVNSVRSEVNMSGVTGGLSTFMSGQMYRMRPGFRVLEGQYPVVYIGQDPDAENAEDCPFYGKLTVDPELWERMPLSWIMRIIEESEQEEAQQ